MKYFLKHLDIEKDVDKDIIFVDDVTITEDEDSQAFIFFNKLQPHKEKRTILTFVANKKTVAKLNSINVEVISPIILEDRDKCFDDNSEIFTQHKNHMNSCKDMVLHYGKKLDPDHPLGFKNAQLMFGFFYNTPDNTLPIFWSESNDWYPIVKRYDKRYFYHFVEDERFV